MNEMFFFFFLNYHRTGHHLKFALSHFLDSASWHEYFFNVIQLRQNTIPIQAEFHIYRAIGEAMDPNTASKFQSSSSHRKVIPSDSFIFVRLSPPHMHVIHSIIIRVYRKFGSF